MKKHLLSVIAFGLLTITIAKAQSAPEKRFDATYSTGGSYTHLSSSAIDAGLEPDWIVSFTDPIDLPFEFNFQNVLVDYIVIETFGSLLLNGVGNEDFEMGHIAGINMPYTSAGRGKILYETVGAAGDRIFKVEFQNMGRYDDDAGNDTLNYQIWLYEKDNAIEYRAGYCNVPDEMFGKDIEEVVGGKEGLMCGLLCNDGDELSVETSDLFIHSTSTITGAFSDTTIRLAIVSGGDIDAINTITHGAYPPEGSVMRFAPKDGKMSLSKIELDMASVFPNPSVDGIFTLRMKDAVKSGSTLSIFDINGRVVSSQMLSQSETKLDLSKVAAGQYIGRIVNGGRQGVFKITRQ